mgnify:CR=1 FL=1
MNLNKGCIEIIPPAVPHYSKHGRMNLNKGCIEIGREKVLKVESCTRWTLTRVVLKLIDDIGKEPATEDEP